MNYGNRKAKCPILQGVHQTARSPNDLYRAEPFRVYSYMIGLHSAVVTTSWLYACQSQRDVKCENSWNFRNILAASEPCREATSMYSDSKFPVRILRILTYQPCIYEGMDMHSVDTLVCQIWGKYRWIMEIARQNVLFGRGSIKRLDLQMTYRYRLKLSASIPIWQGYHPL